MKGFLFIPEMAVAACRDVAPKINTRRVMGQQPSETHETADRTSYRMAPKLKIYEGRTVAEFLYTMGEIEAIPCDYRVGERRCLLTTWATNPTFNEFCPTVIGDLYDHERRVRDDFKFWHAGMGPRPDGFGKNRPGRFLPNMLRHLMPVFEVVSVRAERVQSISEEDAKAEGVELIEGNPRRHDGLDYSSEFASLWDSINAKRGFGWSVNPWVWVITFKRVTA